MAVRAAPNNTCLLDADCATGSICSGEATVRVCRCLGGIDSCDVLNTCRPRPPPVARDTRTPCQRCGDCLTGLQSAVASTNNVSYELAESFYTLCMTNLTTEDTLSCKRVASAISFSRAGSLAKRAGALCSRLGLCSEELLATSSTCNMTVATGKAGRLSLCTNEGVGNYTVPVAGVLQQLAALQHMQYLGLEKQPNPTCC